MRSQQFLRSDGEIGLPLFPYFERHLLILMSRSLNSCSDSSSSIYSCGWRMMQDKKNTSFDRTCEVLQKCNEKIESWVIDSYSEQGSY